MGGEQERIPKHTQKKNGGREYVGGINKQYFIFKADSERGKKKSSLDGKAARLFNGLRQLFMHLFIGRVGWQVQPIEACVRLG